MNLSMVAAGGQVGEDRQARLARVIENDYRLIWRLLRRLGVPDVAVDDAAQEVFLIVAERLDDIRERSERAFAFGTALRVARSTRRRVAREPASDRADLGASPLPGPDELSDQKRARELLDRILDEINPELRAVLVLFELEGLRSPEIAEIIGVPLGTVASRLRRAREAFRVLVERETSKKSAMPGGSP